MPDITAISSALSALSAAKDIAQGMIGLRDNAVFQSKLIEFQSKIIDAQNNAIAANEEHARLIERIHKLEAQVADLEAWDAERQKCELVEFRQGNFAFRLKQASEQEPSPLLCPTCFENRKKSVLQRETRIPGRRDHYVCHECGADIVNVRETATQTRR